MHARCFVSDRKKNLANAHKLRANKGDGTSDYHRQVTVGRETGGLPERLRGNKQCQASAFLFRQLSHTAHLLWFTLKLHRMLSYAEPHRVLRPVTEAHY